VSLHVVDTLFKEINEKVFAGYLSRPVIRITRARKYYGTCVRRESDNGKRLAILISGPLHRDDGGGGTKGDRLLDTLAHEMVHLWQYQKGLRYNEHDNTFLQWLPVIKEKLGIELVRSWEND